MTEGINNDELIRRAIGGDKAAFAVIVVENQSLVFSLGYHFLRDSALAEEIAQDIFLQLYRDLGTIHSASHLVAWLRRATLNRCIDQSRRRAYRRETPLDEGIEPTCTEPTPDLIASELLRKHVATLSEMHRAVVILRYQEGLEPGEIAETLGVPLNTVKSRLQRALQLLRSRLERQQRQAV